MGFVECIEVNFKQFCDIQNNQGRGKCYQPKPKAEADNTNRDLDYISHITKTESNNCFIIHCFQANNDKRRTNALSHRTQLIFDTPCSYFAVRELDIALGNHALHL